MLGAGPAFIARGGFSWADAPAMPNPWEVLAAGNQSPVPVVLDQTTATYGLNPPQGRGDKLAVHDADDHRLDLQVAGLLNDSIFQGELLLNDESLRHYDPDAVGYRYFLIETPPGKATLVQQALQQNLGDYGFATETTVDRLSPWPPFRIRISPHFRASADWGFSWARSGWPWCNGETSWNGGASWPCSAPRDSP